MGCSVNLGRYPSVSIFTGAGYLCCFCIWCRKPDAPKRHFISSQRGRLYPRSTCTDHPDDYFEGEYQTCRCSNTTPIWSCLLVPSSWACWALAGLVLRRSEHWLCPGLEPGCACAAPLWPGLKQKTGSQGRVWEIWVSMSSLC